MLPTQLCSRGAGSLSVLMVIGLSAAICSSPAQSETCVLSPEHAGITFPVEKLDPDWVCRLYAIVDHYTTVSKVGPVRTGLSESLYRQLLDRPPLAAALIKRLDLGLYKSEARGPGRFWGDDGEGTKGIVQLVYQDRTSRIYYLEGSHDSRLLPNIAGKAVVFLRMDSVTDADWDRSGGQYYGRLHEVGQSRPLRIGLFAAPAYWRDRKKEVKQRGGDRQSIEYSHAATSRPCAVRSYGPACLPGG